VPIGAQPEVLRRELADALPDRPFTVEFWDGSRLPSTNGNGGPVFGVRSPAAIAHALRAPGQLGLGRAYVSGALDVDDVDAVLDLLGSWKPPPIDRAKQARLMVAAVRAMGLTMPPRRPESELVPRGKRHSQERDARAVRHHYDVSNEFFALFLDESLSYSCAFFSKAPEGATLEEAQRVKLEVTAAKLDLQAGQRVLDVGSGWGAFAIHTAQQHDVHVTGITLSEPQARLARERAEAAGVGDRVDFRVMDYRDLPADETYDAIASIGMVEHVGAAQIDVYAHQLARLLKPGGYLLNHGIARLRHGDPEAGPFSERYVFPDAAPLHLPRSTLALERAGFETLHIEGFRHDYAETLRHWASRLDDNIEEARRLAGDERIRVWRLYLRAARNGFETGFTSIYQARCRLTNPPTA
jgi:cyclopropane-fatty-acyl-phospholipid synthase